MSKEVGPERMIVDVLDKTVKLSGKIVEEQHKFQEVVIEQQSRVFDALKKQQIFNSVIVGVVLASVFYPLISYLGRYFRDLYVAQSPDGKVYAILGAAGLVVTLFAAGRSSK